ncbi:MAG TPA: MBL fold metallo-hydrolase [Bacillota bacterium]|nr:MBL fold metallo-hydrolase [Bacillota bacterium]
MSGTIRWLSVAFVEYRSTSGQVILFDPWTKSNGNWLCPYENRDIKEADLILVSHDHQDHIASASDLTKQTGALLGGPDETMKRLIMEEGLTEEQIVNHGAGYLVGGGTELPWVKVVTTPAHHTSRTSMPLGTIAILKDGTTLYHAGDTSITAEMEIYGRLYPLDLAILPIFGQATMDYIQAAEAVRLMHPRKVMPIHFDFCAEPAKVLNQFVEHCKDVNPNVEVIMTEIGKEYHI